MMIIFLHRKPGTYKDKTLQTILNIKLMHRHACQNEDDVPHVWIKQKTNSFLPSI